MPCSLQYRPPPPPEDVGYLFCRRSFPPCVRIAAFIESGNVTTDGKYVDSIWKLQGFLTGSKASRWTPNEIRS
ncbi:hypothetical protein AVEN_172187-1 [Araneus ventricosus]|uniref:Uncharacterized protein n=1 Tax=Araneus ventricosus TaxID=182803 RepID=A0A4Y2XA84_ARAVE|nr:hypothetical protein AVEN_18288-1 [Araneus ventricosus]GBO45827.1 hypothetical protein AVEN_48058-1 [Araneus ventricosus]GBO45830.1 hypothetical protein AVEN_141015-1 [Araneus ventricosus]GBO45831.1 hypothetical protein AVEN_172187-1 [Araneus ventricosus]